MIDKRLFQLVEKKPLIQLVAFRVLQLLCSLGMWLLFAGLLASLLTNQRLTTAQMLGFVLGVMVFAAGKAFLSKQMEAALFDSSANLRLAMREKVMTKAVKLGDTQEQWPATKLSQLAIDGIEQLEIYYARFLPQFFYCMIASLIIFVTLVCFAWRPALILFIGVPLIPITIMLVMKIAKKILHRYWGKYTDLGTSFYENLQGFPTLKAFHMDEVKEKEMDGKAEAFRKITMRLLSMQLNSITIMDLISYGGAGLGIALAIKAYLAGQTSLMGALLFLLLSAELFIPMRQLGSLFHVAMNGISACSRLFDYLELPETTYGATDLAQPLTTVHAKELTFSYEKEQPALTDIHLHLQQGRLTAFVGASGSGKSTLAKLLLGRLGNQTSAAFWNDVPLQSLTRETLRDKGVLVDSHAYLYPTTIRENLLLAKPEADEKTLWRALTAVSLAEEVRNMPQQLDTVLEENAKNLSGGQRQRVIVAQALLKEADFYVFDEITSGVDFESEQHLLHTVHQLAKDKIVLFVSHRLYNVEEADEVVVLDKGRIVAKGTPAELKVQDGFFKAYFESEAAILRGHQA